MDNNINLKNIKAWPFVEAFKILKKLERLREPLQTINFETWLWTFWSSTYRNLC